MGRDAPQNSIYDIELLNSASPLPTARSRAWQERAAVVSSTPPSAPEQQSADIAIPLVVASTGGVNIPPASGMSSPDDNDQSGIEPADQMVAPKTEPNVANPPTLRQPPTLTDVITISDDEHGDEDENATQFTEANVTPVAEQQAVANNNQPTGQGKRLPARPIPVQRGNAINYDSEDGVGESQINTDFMDL